MKVSVVIPALNEEATVAGVVTAARASCASEVIVVDSDSTDNTAAVARDAGATVLNWKGIAPDIPVRPGKGEALWRGVRAATGDVVVFLDADVTTVEPEWVDKLAGEFASKHVQLVKATYRRTLDGVDHGGGRVTELTAKPLLNLLFPEIPALEQPLAGEYAIRRDAALSLPFVAGYGVEVGLLIDIATAYGPNAITQVNLGVKTHRNRPLAQLAGMSDIVARTILNRAGVADTAVEEREPWVG
ncbi:glucosyl-3-phosphoglycerate synthase [Corynebacterium sp. MSK041]|uniref:glucosyl-3-phosphoglycerate synthase n=1 Tax=Corynebacterium sp. MSK041 TaxID=3050194 RepID=UPI00254CC789|nr:glucosyl-3-phosphoglycerate synthase [Corynebacterium sp. MSK041]MDK8794802.1 glucosyl-3-phosphoglycerate synthase [Corynebacterium sp. MSK041]